MELDLLLEKDAIFRTNYMDRKTYSATSLKDTQLDIDGAHQFKREMFSQLSKGYSLHVPEQDLEPSTLFHQDFWERVEEWPEWEALKANVSQWPEMAEEVTEKLLKKVQEIVEVEQQNGNGENPFGNLPADGAGKLKHEMQQSAAEAQDMNNMGESFGFGLGESGNPPTKTDIYNMRKLAKRINVQEMIALIGALSSAMSTHFDSRADTTSVIPLDIETDTISNNTMLLDLIAFEDTILTIRTITNDLRKREFIPEPPEVGGPVLVLVDSSGSMGETEYAHASAIALATHAACMRKFRPYRLFNFSSDVLGPFRGENTAEILDGISSYQGSGTNYDKALSMAADELQRFDKRADILMISDGEAYISPGVMQALKQKDVRVFFMDVGGAVGKSKAEKLFGELLKGYAFMETKNFGQVTKLSINIVKEIFS
jgi:hypothetical protein